MAMQRCPSTKQVEVGNKQLVGGGHLLLTVPCRLPYGHEDEHAWAIPEDLTLERGPQYDRLVIDDASADYA